MKENLEKVEELVKLAKDWIEFANITDGIKIFKKDNLKVSCYDEDGFKAADFADFQGNDIKLLFHTNSPVEINGFTLENIAEIDKIIETYSKFLKEEVKKQKIEPKTLVKESDVLEDIMAICRNTYVTYFCGGSIDGVVVDIMCSDVDRNEIANLFQKYLTCEEQQKIITNEIDYIKFKKKEY